MTLSQSKKIFQAFWQKRPQKERGYILAGAMLTILCLWYIGWENNYQPAQTSLSAEKKSLQEKLALIEKQNQLLKKNFSRAGQKEKHRQLLHALENIRARINRVSSQLISSTVMTNALNSLIAQTPELKLMRLINPRNIALDVPENLLKFNHVKLYQHDFIVEFQGNYLGTLAYLKKLEKAPFHFYCDSLDYSVIKYPTAIITLKLHTISKEKELINAG